MRKGRPPDILRKSHRHVQGKQRAKSKEELRREAVHEQDVPASDESASSDTSRDDGEQE